MSIILILIPTVVIVAIFLHQGKPDMSRFGIGPTVAEKTMDESVNGLAQLAPQRFEPFGPAESYDEESLYEKINGKAPLYTESGFQNLSTQRYINEKDENLTFELYLYDMGSAAGAFSVYSIQRRAESAPVGDMIFAYRTKNALYLAHGRYYCELVGSSESPVLLDAIDFTVISLIEILKDPGPVEIPELSLFPADGLIPNTFILYLNGAFGFDGLTNTFSAKYKINDETVTTFISRQSDSASASGLFSSYYKFLLDNGATEISSTEPDTKYVDFYGSLEAICAKGPFVFGIHQAEDRWAAQTILTRIRDNLLASAKSSMLSEDGAWAEEER